MHNVGNINFSNGQILTPTVSGHLHLNEGFVSDKFISCKGLDTSAGQSGSGGITRANLFDILSSEPNEGESINLKYLDLTDYATINWVNTTFALKTALNDYVLKITYNAAITEINNTKANKSITLTAGDGLTGGGTLEENRTFTLGTPGTITESSENEVSTESHTHAIDKASTSVMGIVKLYDKLDSTSVALALTANQGKQINSRLVLLEDMWENKNTYLLAKSNRGVVSNSFISCGGLDASAVQSGGTFDRSVLFDILSGDPQSGESINLGYLDLSVYDTELESINDEIDTINGYFTNGAANKVKSLLKFGNKSYNGSSEQTITADDLGALTERDIENMQDDVATILNDYISKSVADKQEIVSPLYIKNALTMNTLYLPNENNEPSSYELKVGTLGDGADDVQTIAKIGDLENVNPSANDISTEDVVLIKKGGSSEYIPTKVSDISVNEGQIEDILINKKYVKQSDILTEDTTLIKKDLIPIERDVGIIIKDNGNKLTIGIDYDESTFSIDDNNKLNLNNIDGGII